MFFEQKIKTELDKSWESFQVSNHGDLSDSAQLVLAFGSRQMVLTHKHFQEIKTMYPNACIVMNSTSGEILANEVFDDSLVLTAIQFEKTTLEYANIELGNLSSLEAGEVLGKKLSSENLRHVLVFSDGLNVNGTSLIRGLNAVLPDNVTVTGGLAGDAAAFEQTAAGVNQPPKSGYIGSVGLYGDSIKIGYGSFGGWDVFGPERTVTKSKANVLYELDGKPALELYKSYLGKKAQDLPASGLLFPLSIQSDDKRRTLVRTILSVNEEEQSMTFAGDIPEGHKAHLMKANFAKLVQGAKDAAAEGIQTLGQQSPEMAILISCVGRKLVMGQWIEDEIEAVRETLGIDTVLTGFYSYGELAPSFGTNICYLHNQTMTITLLSEN